MHIPENGFPPGVGRPQQELGWGRQRPGLGALALEPLRNRSATRLVSRREYADRALNAHEGRWDTMEPLRVMA